MKKTTALFLALSSVLLGAAGSTAAGVAASAWASAYQKPVSTSVVFDPTCSGKCEAIVSYQAQGVAKDTAALSWSERVKIEVDVKKALETACVLDDGPRPHAFKNPHQLCSASE